MHACTLGKQALENYKFPSMFSFLDIDLVYTASLWSSAFEIPLIDGGTWGFWASLVDVHWSYMLYLCMDDINLPDLLKPCVLHWCIFTHTEFSKVLVKLIY